MLPHPDSVIAFGLMRHEELQAENLHLRRAIATQPSCAVQVGVKCRLRFWLGADLIRLGTALQVETQEPGAVHQTVPAGIA
jgi:hypothetical protein